MTALSKFFKEEPSSDYKPSSGSMALPAREYVLTVDEITEKSNDFGAVYLDFKLKVVSPEEFKNRLTWVKYHLVNNNSTAVDISRDGLRQLSMCILGREAINTSELLDKPFYGTLKVKKGGPKKDGDFWSDSNTLFKCRPVTNGIPPKDLPTVAVTPARSDTDPDMFNDELPF